MATIYGIVSGQLILYVGKTTLTLKKRESGHRTLHNKSSTRHIPDYIDWEMVTLEQCSVEEGTAREQFWYDTLKPLYNSNRPGQTKTESKAEWCKVNRDAKLAYDRLRYAKNRAAILESKRLYYLKKVAQKKSEAGVGCPT